MGYPPQFLDEIRGRQVLSAVITRAVKLTRRGHEFVGLCPFHHEKSPSFTVNDDKGFFHCFGCGAHGDVIAFVMRNQGLSFPDTVEKLAGECGLSVPQPSPEGQARARRAVTLYEATEAACAWFQRQLHSGAGADARDYLQRRGISESTIERFRLGFAPASRGRLRQDLGALGLADDVLVEAGLAKRADGPGNALRDTFFARIIFPITDVRGRVIAFGGRALGDGTPKYLNSPETPLFHKGHVLYGLASARQAVRSSARLLVVEGYTDVMALAQAGFGAAVAPLGTALTEAQLTLLWRLVDEPVLCFDADAAGERAASRVAERALPLLAGGKSLNFIALPAGHDPDSFVAAHGAAALEALVAKPQPLVDVVWAMETGGRKVDTPERRAALQSRLDTRIRAIGDRTTQRAYQAEFFARMRRLTWPIARGADRPGRNSSPRTGSPMLSLGQRGDFTRLAAQQEKLLLALVVNHPLLIDGYGPALEELSLTKPANDQMLAEILNASKALPSLDSAGLQRHLRDRGFAKPLDAALGIMLDRQAPFAGPDAVSGTAERALEEFLAWYGRRQPGVPAGASQIAKSERARPSGEQR